MYNEVKKCRICGSDDLVTVLSLGEQSLTGVFPRERDLKITSGPLELVKCSEHAQSNSCGLLQLRHSYDLSEMYGLNYGYRSGLNRSMVEHLHSKVARIEGMIDLRPEDLVIDIGSNDSTLLQGYRKTGCTLVGVDPTGQKFKDYYPSHIQLIPEFFSAAAVRRVMGDRKARVITSIAMFYDLESPIDFMREIHDTLSADGIWVFEQSYMPTMLAMNAYDTICHEHLEYYGLQQIKWMTDRVGLKILDVELNAVNGGSFSVTVAKNSSMHREATEAVQSILREEEKRGLASLGPYQEFKERIFRHRDDLLGFMERARSEKKTVMGYGASTKGNVILQFCKIKRADLPFIGEVNADKFGCFTPGSLIPIVSEEEIRQMKPDYMMVLPWHFKAGIVAKEQAYLERGGRLFFPLPELEVVGLR